MSAVAYQRPRIARRLAVDGLPRPAQAYLVAVGLAAGAAALPQIARLRPETGGWLTFLLLATGAAFAQLLVVRTPRNQSYHMAIVFVLPAALMLPPELVALMGIVQHIPEWLKVRYAWYIQSFNICNYTLDALAAWQVARLVGAASHPGDARWALAGLAACVTFVVLNHVVLAVMLRLARGHGLRETGLFSPESLSTDLVLAALGVALASFSRSNPWLIPAAIAPLVLIQRSLSVPALQEEARVDPKTGLANSRHFTSALREELARAHRFGRPMALIMADLDLLRDINNTYGHLAGDAVLQGVSEVFRRQLRPYDIASRFGGEEFAILLPETAMDEAMEIAERVRRAVASTSFEVHTSNEPVSATISMGVAAFPGHGTDANELVHQADLAVYRAKLQGRNRVLSASVEPVLASRERVAPHLEALPASGSAGAPASSPPATPHIDDGGAARGRPHPPGGPRFLSLSPSLLTLVAVVSLTGIAAGVLGLVFGRSGDIVGLLAAVAFAMVGQALALELEGGSISVSAAAALAGAALFGPRAALPLAIGIAAAQWSSRRGAWYQTLFNVGALSLASLAAAAAFSVGRHDGRHATLVVAAMGLVAGGAYYLVNTGLLSRAMALEGHDSWRAVWLERFSWLLPHYVAFGAVGAAIALSYRAIGLYGIAVFALPLLVMRRTMATYLGRSEKAAAKLRELADTIRRQNVSLEHANHLLRERSTAAMESLSATVDARDHYTAGHSRRVEELSLALGRELGLSQAELDLLGYAALFHDIGKLAVPESILLKSSRLAADEWSVMRRHAEEGARIIDRLGFLEDAVPAIRHHHERFDGSGYPDGLKGDEIPLGARIIHIADAFDSMLTSRVYRPALPLERVLNELRRGSGAQFCPRCLVALERVLRPDYPGLLEATPPVLAAASF